jgi:hypothetical protein
MAVRFDEAVWRGAVRGFSREPLQIATSARSDAKKHPADESAAIVARQRTTFSLR